MSQNEPETSSFMSKTKVKVSGSPRSDPAANRLTSSSYVGELQRLLRVHNECHKVAL